MAKQSVVVTLGAIAGLCLFEIFYFSVVVPTSTTLTLKYFWYFYLGWFLVGFALTFSAIGSTRAVKNVFMIDGVIWIGIALLDEGLGGKINDIAYSMLPGWLAGVVLTSCVAIVTHRLDGRHIHKTLQSNAKSNIEKEGEDGHRLSLSETILAKVVGVEDVWNGPVHGVYDVYFTGRRIIGVKINDTIDISGFGLRRAAPVLSESALDSKSIDKIIMSDKKNFVTGYDQVTQVNLHKHAYWTSALGKVLTIKFEKNSRHFVLKEIQYESLKENLPKINNLSGKLKT